RVTHHSDAVARVAVVRVAGELRADLIVTQSEIVRVPLRQKVIGRIRAAVSRKEQEALLGDQVVQLELPHFEVDPSVAPEIVEPDERGLEVEKAVFVSRWEQHEGNVLVQRSRGPQVHTREIETRLREGLRHTTSARRGNTGRNAGRGVRRLLG